jgi:hypothetical protein
MAGFGNSGVPPTVQCNIDARVEIEVELAKRCIDFKTWGDFASDRSHLSETPHAEAAAVITRNRRALVKDTVKQLTTPSSSYYNKGGWRTILPSNESDIDILLRDLAQLLSTGSARQVAPNSSEISQEVATLAAFLDVSLIFLV